MPDRIRAPNGQGKELVTFRLAPRLKRLLKNRAGARNLSVTDYLVLCFRLVSEFYGLSPEMAETLRREQESLHMNELEYVRFIAEMRSIGIRSHGPGYELPATDRKRLGIAPKEG